MRRLEQELQRQAVGFLTLSLPKAVFWTAILPAPVNNPVMGAINRGLGAKPSIPDLVFWWAPHHCAAIELKTAKGRLSPAQEACHERLRAAGVMVDVCRSLDEVIDSLKNWGVPMHGRVAA